MIGNMEALFVDSVSKKYGSIRALNNVSFRVDKREYLCILGPIGAGKTTLLKIISGLLLPDSGRIYIDGVDKTFEAPENRGISYMPQGYALFPHMTVWENVAYGVEMRGFSMDRAKEALEIVGLYHRRNSFPHELSGGQQQRIALARALAAGTEILLLDEPLSALDVLIGVELRYELKRLARKLGLTVLHVTHNVEEALSIADRVLILKRGYVQQIGKPEHVYLNPVNLFVANFLGEVNVFEGLLKGARYGNSIVDVNGLGEVYVTSRPIDKWHVVVAFRPEDIIITDGESRYDINVFKGMILNREFVGALAKYQIAIGDYTVRVYSWNDGKCFFDAGDSVTVYFPPHRGILYPYPREGLLKMLEVEGL